MGATAITRNGIVVKKKEKMFLQNHRSEEARVMKSRIQSKRKFFVFSKNIQCDSTSQTFVNISS